MGLKTPPWKDCPSWTTAKFFGHLRGALRAAHKHWPPKIEALKAATEDRPVFKGDEVQRYKTGVKAGQIKTRKEAKCSSCKQWFRVAEIEMDHIEPCGSLKSYDDWLEFTKRMFSPVSNYRPLCKPCHKEITKKGRG